MVIIPQNKRLLTYKIGHWFRYNRIGLATYQVKATPGQSTCLSAQKYDSLHWAAFYPLRAYLSAPKPHIMFSTPQLLQAGPVQVRYENGFLRYLSVNETEILRMIYFAIRDRNWQTPPFTIAHESIVQHANAFSIDYDWHISDLGIQLDGHVSIRGNEAGTITVDFYGKARNTFQRNRIGLCILHPLDGVLGQPVQVLSPEGHVTDTHFPTFIRPHQPFLNIQTFRWKPASGQSWQLDVEGDVFETEDQRNWTDASFKTYSTPVSLPKPVTIQPGQEIRQQVTFRAAEQPVVHQADDTQLALWQQALTTSTPGRPRVGVSHWAGGRPLSVVEVDLLRELSLSHLRVDVFLTQPDWPAQLSSAIADATLLGLPLELALFFGNTPEQEFAQLSTALKRHAAVVQSFLLFDAATVTTSNALLAAVRPLAKAAWPTAAIGGGTDENFVELNRNPFDFTLVDFVTYSASPEAHASDDLTIWENIAGQVNTVLSARQLTNGKPVHLSPVTLKLRFITIAGAATERLQLKDDPRQRSDFGAEWTRQSLDALASAGVESVTYYLTHGPNGLVDEEETYPVYDVLREWAAENG